MARPSTFGERFGYAVWLMHLRNGKAPTWRDVARATDRSGEAVAAWIGMETAPDSHSLRKMLSDYTGLPATWLMDGDGEAPMPALWKEWSTARRVKVAGKDTKGASQFDREKAAGRAAK